MAKIKHNIQLGSVVEWTGTLQAYTDQLGEIQVFGKFYVVGHIHDLDGTPLYVISDLPVYYPNDARVLSESWLRYVGFGKILEMGITEPSLYPTGQVRNLEDYVSFTRVLGAQIRK